MWEHSSNVYSGKAVAWEPPMHMSIFGNALGIHKLQQIILTTGLAADTTHFKSTEGLPGDNGASGFSI